MSIVVAGFDVHRSQITFDALDRESGELWPLPRLRKTLVDERAAWLQRIQATLFHHGVGGAPARLRSAGGRAFLARLELPGASLKRIEVSVEMIEALDRQLEPIETEL